MMKSHKLKISLMSCILFFSCSFQTNQQEPINALTTIKEFNPYVVAGKLKKVRPISSDELLGKWDLIASFFSGTNKDGRKYKTTFGLERRKYHFMENGELIIDSRGLGVTDIPNRKWVLNSEKTAFQYGNEKPYNIRIIGDTMEWFCQIGEKEIKDDYMYFVLTKSYNQD